MSTQSFSLEKIRVIVGLGNPGPSFTYTRHNMGFLFLDHLASAYGLSWKQEGKALTAQLNTADKALLLIKPQTFMNSSGETWPLCVKRGAEAESMLIVHDELEKKVGLFQVRLGGSARGHNGLRSFISRCGENFWRLRLGIDRPAQKEQVPHYVLERFSKEEQALLPALFTAAQQALGL